MPNPLDKSKVAVVIPHYRDDLTEPEQTSLRQCLRQLPGYDKYFVLPEGCRLEHPEIRGRHLPAKYFRCRICYSTLLTSAFFYEAFRNYEYILIYQLDCLVFRDELLDWCAKGYDYIGAPIFTKFWPELHKNVPASFVGNGGLSLRRVSAHLRVLKQLRKTPGFWLRRAVYFFPAFTRQILFYLRLVKRLLQSIACGKNLSGVLLPVHHYAMRHDCHTPYYFLFRNNEDMFWSLVAPKIDPAFKIPALSVAAEFSIEEGREECFRLTGGKIPFGCHYWNRWPEQAKFWLSQIHTL